MDIIAFVATVFSGVIAGVILLFIERIYFSDKKLSRNSTNNKKTEAEIIQNKPVDENSSKPVLAKNKIKNKNTSKLLITLAFVFMCGCPGLYLCSMGSSFFLASLIPGVQVDIMGSNDPATATALGIASLCVSIIFIAIPVGVGFFTMRKKPESSNSEPIPPVS